jgi:ketol-acid reductoisomerase
MATLNFGGTDETVITRDEFPLSKAQEVLKNEVVAVIGYGVQGPGQALNQKDNGINVIVGQRKNSKTWDKAIRDGFVPGDTLFEIEEALEKGTIICYLISDAAQIELWPTVKKHLTKGKALYFSHGFGITFKEQTGIIPPADVDVFLVAPKGSGTSLRRMFLQGRGLNSSYAIFQDATGRAKDRVIALGIAVGSGYLFETNFKKTAHPKHSTKPWRNSHKVSCLWLQRMVWIGCMPIAQQQHNVARWIGGRNSVMPQPLSLRNCMRALLPEKNPSDLSTVTARKITVKNWKWS